MRRFAPIMMRRNRRSRWRGLGDHDGRNPQIHGVQVTSDLSDVFVNVAGLAIPAGGTILIDLTLGQ